MPSWGSNSMQQLATASGKSQLSGSVGRGGVNRRDDVLLVQSLLNDNLPIPLEPLDEDGICGPKTIFAIETYQRRTVNLNPPDGRIDPRGVTLRSLTGGGIPQPVAPQPVAPEPSPTVGPVAPTVAAPSNMRESAWRYLLRFTKNHEGAVLNMYNNRKASSKIQDVTCGVGFRLAPRSTAAAPWVKAMFYDPATKSTPTNDQMLADWDAAASLPRTKDNLPQYRSVCLMRMYADRVYDQMALILRDQKLRALLKSFPTDFANFTNFPAAAQVFCVSFAYGRIPFDFPIMRAAIRDERWADASTQCRLKGCSERKNQGHAQLLLLAQTVVDQQLDLDTLPSTLF